MTSIAGVVSSGPAIPGDTTLSTMLDAMPGHLCGPRSIVHSGRAIFGRTLSIKLPEDRFDQQPLRRENLMLVGDIRLDSRSELAADLNVDVAEMADSDVLLSCWERSGVSCLERLRGDFAFAIYDRSSHEVWLVRDPASRRAMHYALVGDTLIFATMPGAILASGLVEPNFHLERLATQLMGFVAVSRQTPFTHIFTLLGGEVARLSSDGLVIERYWNPNPQLLALSDAEFDASYHRLMEQAVRDRARRDTGRLAVHLSAGFDSSAVAAFAGAVDEPIAYTSAPRDGYAGGDVRDRLSDESGLAARTARHLGIDHRVIRATGSALALLRRDARIVQEPDRNALNQPWWQQIQAAARDEGVTTLLTGSLGNLSIHYGGLQALGEWREVRGWRAWLRQALAARSIATVRWRGILFNSFKAAIPARLSALLERVFQGAAPTRSISFVLPSWNDAETKANKREERFFRAGSAFEQRLALIQLSDFSLIHHGGLAVFGIDERDPIADRDVIEFSLRLPPEQLIRDGVPRPMMRRALAGLLPPEVMANPFRGQQTADWHENLSAEEALAMVDEVQGSPTLRQLIDFPKLRRAISDWPTGGWGSVPVTTVYRRMIPLTLSVAAYVTEFEAMIESGDYRHPCP